MEDNKLIVIIDNNAPEEVADEWTDLFEYVGIYKINKSGQIKNNRERILTSRLDATGRYIVIRLNQNGIAKCHLLHRLLAMTFIPNPHNKLQVNHIDGKKTNNLLNNLEWCTPAENLLHAWRTGLRKPVSPDKNRGCIAEKKICAFRDELIDGLIIKQELNFDSIKNALLHFNKNKKFSGVSHCINGKAKTSMGWRWKLQNA